MLAEKWNLNVDGGLLDAKKEPRNQFETYKRLTFSARIQRKWKLGEHNILEWNGATDYALNVDNVKTDPEIQIHKEDRYRSSYLKIGMNNRIVYRRLLPLGLQRASFAYTASVAFDKIHQTEAVALQRDYVVPLAYESGEYDGLFLPFQYISNYRVEGIPFYTTFRGETEWTATKGRFTWEVWTKNTTNTHYMSYAFVSSVQYIFPVPVSAALNISLSNPATLESV